MKIQLPIELIYTTGSNETRYELKKICQNFKKICMISGLSVSCDYAKSLRLSCVKDRIYHLPVGECSLSVANCLNEKLKSDKVDCIVAVGGGRVVDLCKKISKDLEINLVSIPTSIANDGLISPISVIRDGNYSISIPGKMPNIVILDLQSITQAPVEFIHAASCDIVTNLSATNDWDLSQIDNDLNQGLAKELAIAAANAVLNMYTWDLNNLDFVKTIISGQILSGISMAVSGSSRPCSGAEHLLSHAMDYLKIAPEMLHGKKVAIAARFVLRLQNKTTIRLDEYFNAMSIPKRFPVGTENVKYDLMKIFATARNMRPGRKTVLDEFSDEELFTIYLQEAKNE